MKKLSALLLLILCFQIFSSAQNCPPCPDFIHIRDSMNCNFAELHGQQPDASYSNTPQTALKACQFSSMTYSLLPTGYVPGVGPCLYPLFQIDTVVVVGGTLLGFTTTGYSIQWGGANTGTVQIQFGIPPVSAGVNPCNGTITIHYSLLANPIAAFSIAPNPACFNNPTTISFNSSASVGAVSYFWDFGDGFTSTAANPTHAYTSPGSYVVCLTVSNAGGGQGTAPNGNCLNCVDSVCQTLIINNLPGPDISCIASVCAGETATYCTGASCSTYNWIVTGGVIISPSPSTSNCITVQWGSGNPQGNIHLDVPGCPGFCPQGTDITVPIIPATTTINGGTIVCLGATSAYNLPSFPGTTYAWSISGGQPINGNNTNTPQINTTWNMAGTYTITCVYFDTALNCGGTGSLVVQVLPELNINGPLKRCAGQNGTLNAFFTPPMTPVSSTWSISPAVGATILSGNGTPSILVNWANAGTYVVTATSNTPGVVCAPVSFTVVVYPSPVISSINGADSICANGVAVYSATSNMAGLFSWSVVGGTFTPLGPNDDSIQINWNPSGPYSITVSQTSYANNCPGLPLIKQVYAYPTPIVTGSMTVCADDTVTYTITNIGASNFNWSVSPAQFGTVISSSGSSVQIKWHGNNNPGGSNTVYLRYGNCGTDSIAITISEPISPVITDTGSLCNGGGMTLFSSGTGIFNWFHVEAPPYSSATSVLSGINHSGHYTVVIQNYNGTGCTVQATRFIPAVGLPVAQISADGPLYYCDPNRPSMNLVALSGIGYNYQWYLGVTPVGTNSPILPVNTSLVNAVGVFSFTCVVTKGLCSATSNTISVVVVDTCVPTPPCPGNFIINSISGCNPFNIGIALQSGAYIVPGSESITHLEDGLVLGGLTSRVYTGIGIKQIRVCATIKLADSTTCLVCKDTIVTVTVAANFLKNVTCSTVYLTDLSNTVPPVTVSSYSWSVTPFATFNNPGIPSPVLTFSTSGIYTITQTITASNGCIVTKQDTVSVNVPDADFSVSNSCVGTGISFNNNVPAPVNYWDFGDASSSNVSPTIHAYATSGIFNVTHIVTDAFGCKDTVTKPVTIIPAPTCIISYTGPTTFCFGNSLLLNACAGLTSYQWFNNGVAVSGATNGVYAATQTGNYSFTAVNPLGCNVMSDTVTITVLQTPSTNMTTTGKACFGENYSISVPSCLGCIYVWEVNGTVVQAGPSGSLSGSVGSMPFMIGAQLIKVTVMGSNGCNAMDSVLVTFNPQPTITLTVGGNPPQLCSNNIYTLYAASNAASPVWAWTYSNFNTILSTTDSLVASAAGMYQVLVTDGITGCTNMAMQVIDESPDLSLFPIGCDTLCQNTSIFLPLASFNGNIAGYTITWYDNAPPYTSIVGTGIALNLTSLSLGAHNLSVIVVGPNGCVDTSNVYNIFIVPATSSVTNATACGSYTWVVNGITYTASGQYTSTSINANGCPQLDTLNLIISNTTGSSTSIMVCDQYTWPVNGVTYTQSGVYVHTVLLASGCIQSDTLFLQLKYATETAIAINTCDSSYTWPVNGVTYTLSGTYTVTSVNQNGCVHTDILMLNIGTGTSTLTIATGCISYTWSVNNITYTNSGIYTQTSQVAGGCIHTDSLILTIIPITGSSQSVTVCAPYTWPVNGVTYTTSGTYYYFSLSTQNCEQIDTLNLTIGQPTETVLSINTCNSSYTWPVNGVTYTLSGTYTVTSLNQSGCVHTNILQLQLQSGGGSSQQTVSICGSYTWPVNGVTYTQSGIYTHTVSGTTGCIDTFILNLTILPPTTSTVNVIICDVYTWPINGVTYTTSGTYTHTSVNANGCIHISTLILTIQYSTIITTYIDTCGSYTWPVNGVTYTANCIHTFVEYDTIGCPTMYVLCLTIHPPTSSVNTVTACGEYQWPVNGVVYTLSGIYTATSLNSYGCLHTDSLILTIQPIITTTTSVTACNAYTWPVNGVTYTTSGTYIFTQLQTTGCPHVYILQLTITQGTSSVINQIACDAYTWPLTGITYTASGTYTHTVLNANGCVHTTTLNLTINSSTVITTFINACTSYTWPVNGITYTASGTYTVMTIGPNGCPRLYVLCLIIYPSTSANTTVVACDTYTWSANGQTYTTSGIYTYTSLNAFGCLQTHTLNLTIHYNTNSSSVIDACDSYTWPLNGVTYTASGTYTHTYQNTSGCIHTATLHLTILPSGGSNTTIVACNSYTWPVNGITYTQSGSYTFTTINANDCFTTHTLQLTIHTSSSSTTNITACNSYTWPLNGITYTNSGTYVYTFTNEFGCINTHTLNLVINPGHNTVINVNACDMYTWVVNNVTYTQSGTYVHTVMNSLGCIDTTTLVLILGTSTTTISLCDTACCEYTWAANGVTYTESGVYYHITTGPEGCPHFYILCITILPCHPVITQVTACVSYTWPVNGINYTTSGTYTATSTNSFGCPVVNILQLQIDTAGVTFSASCDTVCGSFTWPVNGITYTASGVYTHVTTGANGCPHTYVICITIRQHTASSTQVTATASYTWPVNGVVYTASGTYTATLVNIHGCDSVITLYLNLFIPPGHISIAIRAFLSGAYQPAEGLMSDSLRQFGYLPLQEPYSAAPYVKPQLLGGGGETASSSVFSVVGQNAIVDWMHIEIRPASNPNIIVATKNALIQRDGDIVEADGFSIPAFYGLPAGAYHVSIKHRNHLGVMTAIPIVMTSGTYTIDFTSTLLYNSPSVTLNPPALLFGGIQLLWSGDPNTNKNVKYNGSMNDKDPILQTVGIATPNNVVYGYRREDANLDGKVRYNNTNNDRVVILNSVGSSTPNKVIFQHTPN